MLDKVKKVIEKNKKDKDIFVEYIKCFCESEKANVLFKENEEFTKLKNSIKNKKEYYD